MRFFFSVHYRGWKSSIAYRGFLKSSYYDLISLYWSQCLVRFRYASAPSPVNENITGVWFCSVRISARCCCPQTTNYVGSFACLIRRYNRADETGLGLSYVTTIRAPLRTYVSATYLSTLRSCIEAFREQYYSWTEETNLFVTPSIMDRFRRGRESSKEIQFSRIFSENNGKSEKIVLWWLSKGNKCQFPRDFI